MLSHTQKYSTIYWPTLKRMPSTCFLYLVVHLRLGTIATSRSGFTSPQRGASHTFLVHHDNGAGSSNPVSGRARVISAAPLLPTTIPSSSALAAGLLDSTMCTSADAMQQSLTSSWQHCSLHMIILGLLSLDLTHVKILPTYCAIIKVVWHLPKVGLGAGHSLPVPKID